MRSACASDTFAMTVTSFFFARQEINCKKKNHSHFLGTSSRERGAKKRRIEKNQTRAHSHRAHDRNLHHRKHAKAERAWIREVCEERTAQHGTMEQNGRAKQKRKRAVLAKQSFVSTARKSVQKSTTRNCSVLGRTLRSYLLSFVPLALQQFLLLVLAHLLAAFLDDTTHVIPSRMQSKCDGTDTRSRFVRQRLRDASTGFPFSACSGAAMATLVLPYKRR